MRSACSQLRRSNRWFPAPRFLASAPRRASHPLSLPLCWCTCSRRTALLFLGPHPPNCLPCITCPAPGVIKACLRKDDFICSTYRDHVHALSKGVSARKVGPCLWLAAPGKTGCFLRSGAATQEGSAAAWQGHRHCRAVPGQRRLLLEFLPQALPMLLLPASLLLLTLLSHAPTAAAGHGGAVWQEDGLQPRPGRLHAHV